MCGMKKIPHMFVALVAVCAAFFGSLVPADAAPAKPQGEPKENWKEVFAEGLFRADGTKVSVSEAFGKKKFVGIYASASWCAPCRYFTPKLVEFYKEFEGQIEVVLIGCDKNEEEVFKYMRDHKMPWLTGKKGSAGTEGYLRRYGIRGIPHFQFFDAKTGKRLVANEIDLRIIRRVITGEKETSSAGTPENWKSFFKAGFFDAGGKTVAPDAALKKKKYLALYCVKEKDKDCARFTKQLVEFYKKNKDKLEIVVVTYGKTQDELAAMLKSEKMPWLAATPEPMEAQRYFIKYRVNKVPDFRVFDAKKGALVCEGTNLGDVKKALGAK